jgi:FkbM family methyltransferase
MRFIVKNNRVTIEMVGKVGYHARLKKRTARMKSPAESILADAFQHHPSHYFAVLPYNLNWMIRDVSPVRDFLTANPIVVADIGARGGHMAELAPLTPFLCYYGFDADARESERLSQSASGMNSCRILPYYVGSQNGHVDFHLYKNPGESSRFKPNPQFQKTFNPDLAIERTVRLPSATLDHIIAAERLSQPDFLKLDTQGSELEILQASPAAVAGSLLIEAEVEFTEIYEGQPLFHDVARFMHESGFELLYLNRVFQSRPSYPGEARGQLIFGDALFGRLDSTLSAFAPERLARYAILLINYGHLDIARQIIETHPEVAALIPRIGEYFPPPQSKADRQAVMAADKDLCRRLHERRTNKLPYDSDRGWPYR